MVNDSKNTESSRHKANTHMKSQTVLQLSQVQTRIAKKWKQPICPLTDKWIMKIWYIYTIDYYSVVTKKETMQFASKIGSTKNYYIE